ncbi:T9SS type A sorting domain-containing protein [Dyadobacter sp. CY261]|uniref:T9SS type A sorting domain-containing protein n=1 Tax=Dyadobacter sp. CY261 TaxID=2907203 RepID=UPI001F30DD62|nr:T9SS type A sorting domain-containing protein [Dyadobacter sp. CY261]MCF0069306.1 T9SS type A sorting domain-containing protein [Dyadobacter sp. CY261]
MKFLKIFAVQFCLFANYAFGQGQQPSIWITNENEVPLCSFTEMRIPIEISGKFNADNKFFIELLNQSDNRPTARYEATFREGSLIFRIDDDKSAVENRLYFRIVSTSPAIQSSVYSKTFYNRGQVSLARSVSVGDTLNTGAGLGLFANVTANNTVTITLNDSSVHEVIRSDYPSILPLTASKSGELFIVKAINTCGVPVPFSGKVSVTINPVTIVPGKIINTALCEGSEMELTYAVAGGTIPESATFKLRFLKGSYSDPNEKRTFEIPARKKAEGILVAKLPDDVVTYSMPVLVAIVVDAPKLVSPYSTYFTIYEKPTASFSSESATVKIGESFWMQFAISGPAPHTVELSNGGSYTLDQNLSLTLNPLKTETFAIRSLKTACGVTTDLPKQTVVANVPDGIVINASQYKKWPVCENQTVRLPFASNVALNANTKLIVEGTTANNTTYQFEAKLVGDSLEFFIPHSPASWTTEGYFSIAKIRVKTTNPSYTSADWNALVVRGVPRVGYESYLSRTLPYPQYHEYKLIVYGGAPFGMTDDKGDKSYAEYSEMAQRIFIPASGAYGPKTVENSCYSSSDLAKMNFTVNPYTSQAPVIVVAPPARKYYCETDSVEVSFEVLGTFGAGNEFMLNTRAHSGENWIKIGKPGRFKVAASAFEKNSYTYLQVKSTNPEVIGSAGNWLVVDRQPALLYPEDMGRSKPDSPIIFDIDQVPRIGMQLIGSTPYFAEFTDGTKNYHFEQKLQYDAFNPPMSRSKVTPFTLKSVGNVCGSVDVNITEYLYWQAYKLSMGYFPDNHTYCAGEEIAVSFKVENGTAPAGTTYSLRIAKDAEPFRTVASNTTGADFKYVIPESMEGSYSIQVSSDAGNQSRTKSFKVNRKPTATVSLADNQTGEVSYGESVIINYQLTGGGPWKMTLAEQGEIAVSDANFTQWYMLSKAADFRLQSVSNSCGFGQVSGNVTVKVNPKIVNFKPERTSVCSGSAIRVTYHIGGDISSGEKIGFYLTNAIGTRFELPPTTATKGTIALPIPAALPGGGYDLTCYITGSDISLSQQIAINKASDIELSGNTTINPGDFTYIHIRPKSEGNQSLNVTLSDGTTLNFALLSPTDIYHVMVFPAKTTTYTITSAGSSCGTVKYSGSAIVNVNAPSDRKVRVSELNKYGTVCENDTILVYFVTSGTFSAGNQFSVQFFDDQGKLAKSLGGNAKESPLKVVIPAGLSTTMFYRIRVTATDPYTASSDYQQIMPIGDKANASFASSSALLDESGKAHVVVLLGGTGPWRYTYGSDLGSLSRYADISPDTILITSKEPSAYFKLLSVTNACGNGTLIEPTTLRVEVVLGNEESGSLENLISVGPNPTAEQVTVRFADTSRKELTLLQVDGRRIWTKNSAEIEETINMRQYPSGIYLLKMEHKGKSQVFRIIKE